MIFVHAIPEVAPPRVGVHLVWSGPHSWVYAPKGWRIQRRPWHGRPRLDCVTLTDGELALLRARHELPIRLGVLTDRTGACPAPIKPPVHRTAAASAIVVPTGCEIITLELGTPHARVDVRADAASSFAVGLRDGKVVAGGRSVTGATTHALIAEGIDTAILYARGLTTVGWCVDVPATDDTGWIDVAHLQLPIRPLMPLADAAAELAEARSRLLPGELLDAAEFAHLAELLRGLLAHAGRDRPIDLTMLVRDDAEVEPEETCALDPLRAVLPHPTWRRALGFAWFDRDPSLVPGRAYEYKVSAGFPAADLADAVFGFHTVPAQTPVPDDFFLGELRVRLPQASRVESFDGAGPIGVAVFTRHGLALAPERPPSWLGLDLEGWSAVIDLPHPVRAVTLLLRGHHALTYAGGAAWLPWAGAATAVPAGEWVTLTFATPIEQLRLGGRGFWCGLRLAADPAVAGTVELQRVLPPVTLAQTPLPAPPMTAGIANLQAPQPVATGDVPIATAPPRQELGFEVRWQPALLDGIVAWPVGLPPPPTEATLFQLEHLATDPPGAVWTPLVDGDNVITGHRDGAPPPTDSGPGVDLYALYPEVRAPEAGPAVLDLTWADVFDFGADGEIMARPPPPPGTHHRYRVRAIDAIGRASATWTETGTLRLEKWAPPPVPVGPDEQPAAMQVRPGPTGVHARVLVQGATDLTAAERLLLGAHANAIVLRWGWHAQQRQQDPSATEFRLYVTRRDPTAIAAQATSVIDHGNGRYDVALTLERPVLADAARGLRLDAGYPFEILDHGAGTAIVAHVIARVPLAGGAYPVPAIGAVPLPLRLAPEATRPPAWGARREIRTIDGGTVYESQPIFDELVLTAAHPSDQLWLGISAADAQPYVPDALGGGRPGNESAIVAVRVRARYQERPAIVEAPSLAPVPVIVAPEPGPRPVEVRLDLTPLLAGTGLVAGARVRVERVSDAEIVRAYRADGGRVIARVVAPSVAGDVEVEVVVPNAGDRAAIVAALGTGRVGALDDRFAVFLAAAHPGRARMFQPAIATPVILPVITDVVPTGGGRWIYRARRADDAGNLSADGVTLRGVVRVPSTTVATPARAPRRPGDADTRLRFRVDGAAEVTHLLVFERTVPLDAGPDSVELIRVPSAPHLALGDRAKLRLGDGALLAGTPIALAAPLGDDPGRDALVDVAAAAGTRVRVWACAITRDGVVSRLAGPFAIVVPPPPLVAPILTVTGVAPNLALAWTWPAPADASEVTVERSADGVQFERVSPRLPATVASTLHRAPPGSWTFRLLARRLDGRVATSNTVEV